MNISEPFIRRPIGTTLLTIAVMLAGALAYFFLPVSPLPQVSFPTISVSASLPGASPETMASSVATPLERQFTRIAGVSEMTSSSFLGATSITLQFDLNRDIDAAARDVQAAINAASGNLPSNLPSKPTWRKVNPSDAPIMILALTSANYNTSEIYDAADSILQQKISQIEGVGQVTLGGGALPAVRADINPTLLNSENLGLEDVRAALGRANANTPKGSFSDAAQTVGISTTDQLLTAADYRPLIIAYKNGAPVRLGDVATVSDSVQDIRTLGLSNGKPAVLVVISRQPNANIIDTVDRVRALIPELEASIPAGIKISVGMDRTPTIRASVRQVQMTLLISLVLVALVVFFFLRDLRTTFIPCISVPVSLLGTFGFMYFAGYTVDNLSLMAMTIATGFVVDDAIVVIENIIRHIEAGMTPRAAALQGAREIGFTIMTISVSLIAVFIPILMMGGIVGRLFREFAVTLSVAITVSMMVSLAVTPMMCAFMLRPQAERVHGRLFQASERGFQWVYRGYEASLAWVLRHRFLTLGVTISTVVVTVGLYLVVPRGFFPQQDTGRLTGTLVADQSISFQAMEKLVTKFTSAVAKDEDVETVLAFLGGGGGGGNALNSTRMFVTLKQAGRTRSADQVMARLRSELAHLPGATLLFQSVQDLRVGGRQSSAQYQFTLQDDDLDELNTWAPRILDKMRHLPGLVDVSSDQQDRGLAAPFTVDRDTASRLGITAQQVDNTLYDAFGQREVSTIYTPLNQYFMVMEVAPKFWQSPEGKNYVYVRRADGTQVPLDAIAHYAPGTTAIVVNHSGQFPSITLSFNLAPNFSLGPAVDEINAAKTAMGVPATLRTKFFGTAQAFQDSTASQPYLIVAALITVYIVLGALYESLIHPLTILSTLPSAGVGALLSLLAFKTDLSVIAVIGIILLIGIVKKNAIMMIDFALAGEHAGLTPEAAIYQACLRRFRPITMTTMAAMLGGLPLALGTGTGSELRRPLGLAIVGGLLFSQMLTLYTTPVVYIYLDRLQHWFRRVSRTRRAGPATLPSALPAAPATHS
jgi:multidrug efflux pump